MYDELLRQPCVYQRHIRFHLIWYSERGAEISNNSVCDKTGIFRRKDKSEQFLLEYECDNAAQQNYCKNP